MPAVRAHDGDVDAVLADCDEVVEGTYHVKANQQAMMETFRTYLLYGCLWKAQCDELLRRSYSMSARILSNALGISEVKDPCHSSRGSAADSVQNRRLCREVYPGVRDLEDGKAVQDDLYQRGISDCLLPRDMRWRCHVSVWRRQRTEKSVPLTCIRCQIQEHTENTARRR